MKTSKLLLTLVAVVLFFTSAMAQDSPLPVSKITGTVLLDTNGNTDGQINGAPITFSSTVYVVLYNPTTERVNYSTTLSGSTYTFTNVSSGTYKVSISMLPSNIGGYYASEMLPDGYFISGLPEEVTITGTEEITGKNIGVIKAPTTDNRVNNYTVYVGGGDIALSDVPLSGKASDGTTISSGAKYVLTVAPDKGFELKYDGETLYENDSILNYNPALLQLVVPWFSIRNFETTTFYYKLVYSGVASEISGSYTVNLDIQDPALPVELTNFNGTIKNNQLELTWQTLSEKNNSKFIVEASTNGVDGWAKIGEVQSKATNGNSSNKLDYNFTISTKEAISLLGASILAALFIPAMKNRKNVIVATTMVGIMSLHYIGCQKSDLLPISTQEKLYVRVVQVDKDGKQNSISEVRQVQIK